MMIFKRFNASNIWGVGPPLPVVPDLSLLLPRFCFTARRPGKDGKWMSGCQAAREEESGRNGRWKWGKGAARSPNPDTSGGHISDKRAKCIFLEMIEDVASAASLV